MIPISADEIKDFWHDYCDRQGVSDALRTAGVKLIDENSEHWADQTMPDLLAAVSPRKAS
jgi:hypothetical protein